MLGGSATALPISGRRRSLHAHPVAGGLGRRAVAAHALAADFIVRHLHDALDELGVVQLGGVVLLVEPDDSGLRQRARLDAPLA